MTKSIQMPRQTLIDLLHTTFAVVAALLESKTAGRKPRQTFLSPSRAVPLSATMSPEEHSRSFAISVREIQLSILLLQILYRRSYYAEIGLPIRSLGSFYAHVRQLHADSTYNIDFATFEKNLLDSKCEFVKRDLTEQQASEFGVVGVDEESIVPKVKVENIPNTSSFDKFPYLDSHNSSVVLRPDRKWVEVRCLIDGVNSSSSGRNSGQKYKGVNGLEQHMRIAHGIRAPEGVEKWE